MKISFYSAASLLAAAMMVFACKPQSLDNVDTDISVLPGAKVNVNANVPAPIDDGIKQGTERGADNQLYVKSEVKELNGSVRASELLSEKGAELNGTLQLAPGEKLPKILDDSKDMDYTLANPAIKLELDNPYESDVDFECSVEMNNTKASKTLKISPVRVPAKSHIVMLVSAKGGLAKAKNEVDVVLPGITDGYKPIPNSISILGVLLKAIQNAPKSGMAPADAETYNFSLTACNFTPLLLMAGSKCMLIYKVSDFTDFKDIYDAATHFIAEGSVTNKTSFDIEVSGYSKVNNAYAVVDNVIKAKATTDFKGDLYTPGGLIDAKDMEVKLILTAVEDTVFDPQKDDLMLNVKSVTYPDGVSVPIK